jgi:hypothetical protein
LGEEFFAKATLRMPHSAVAVSWDAETLGWFQAQGEGAERHMARLQQKSTSAPGSERKLNKLRTILVTKIPKDFAAF